MAGVKAKHLVHGEWMTVEQAAARLGRSYRTLQKYRYSHRREDGRAGPLAEAWDHYTDLNAGRIPKERGGRPASKHRVNGRLMTRRQVAEALGVNLSTIDVFMHNHRCGLDGAWRYYSRKREKKAVRKILDIINGK